MLLQNTTQLLTRMGWNLDNTVKPFTEHYALRIDPPMDPMDKLHIVSHSREADRGRNIELIYNLRLYCLLNRLFFLFLFIYRLLKMQKKK